MKAEYPEYSQGELQELKKKIPLSDRVLLEKFLRYCSINAGEKKVGKIERFIIQLRDITEKPLDKLTKEDIDSFLVVLNKSNRSFWTKNEIKVYLKKFLKWHYKSLDMLENIKLDSRRIDDSKINESNLITEEELERMIRNAQNFRDKALLFLLFETGGRPQEIASLRWRDVKYSEGYGEVNLYSKKNNSSRMFPIKETVIHLKRWQQEYSFPGVKDGDYVFPSPIDRNKPITTTAINKLLKKIAKRSGMQRDVWTYLFRHSRATKLYEELPEQIVERLMGHRGMAEIYAHISSKKVREEMLKKVYHIEKLSEGERTKIEKEIGELKKESAAQQGKVNMLTSDLNKALHLSGELLVRYNELLKVVTKNKTNERALKKHLEKLPPGEPSFPVLSKK